MISVLLRILLPLFLGLSTAYAGMVIGSGAAGGGGGGITVIGTNAAGFVADGTSITQSYSTTTGTLKTLFGLVEYSGTPGAVTGITHDGNAMTAITGASGNNPDGPGSCAAFRINLGSHTGATANVVVSASSAIYGRLQIIELDGVDQTTPTHDGTSTFEETDPSSLTVANVVSTDLVIDQLMGIQTAFPATVGANQTQFANVSAADGIDEGFAASYQSGANGGVMTWDLAGEFRWVGCGFAVKAG